MNADSSVKKEKSSTNSWKEECKRLSKQNMEQLLKEVWPIIQKEASRPGYFGYVQINFKAGKIMNGNYFKSLKF